MVSSMLTLAPDVCSSDQIGQAAGECGVALIAATSALANDALECGVALVADTSALATDALELSGTGANPLGGADVRTGGGDVSGVARSRVCQHEPAGE